MRIKFNGNKNASIDLIQAAQQYESAVPQLFSAEVWGGATFDTAYRFLTENPWNRLEKFVKQCQIRYYKCYCVVLMQ